MLLKYMNDCEDLVFAAEHYSRAQLCEVRRQMTSGEHGVTMILGEPGHISFRWKIEAWKAFEEECK